MSSYQSAVLRQIAFALSVREFLRDILKCFIPGAWTLRFIQESDQEFNQKLDEALIEVDPLSAAKRDYCVSVVGVLCDELARIVAIVKDACVMFGYQEYAERYLSAERFVSLMLRTDAVKLGMLKRVLADKKKDRVRVLREIAAVLDDIDPSSIKCLDVFERFVANDRIDRLVAKVSSDLQEAKQGIQETKQGIADCRNATVAAVEKGVATVNGHVDECAAQVNAHTGECAAKIASRLDDFEARVEAVIVQVRFRRRSSGRIKYTDRQIAAAELVMEDAKNNTELRMGLSTKLTHEAIYDYYHLRLKEYGIEDKQGFVSVLESAQARRRYAQLKSREAKEDAERAARYGNVASSRVEPVHAAHGRDALPRVRPVSVAQERDPPVCGIPPALSPALAKHPLRPGIWYNRSS